METMPDLPSTARASRRAELDPVRKLLARAVHEQLADGVKLGAAQGACRRGQVGYGFHARQDISRDWDTPEN